MLFFFKYITLRKFCLVKKKKKAKNGKNVQDYEPKLGRFLDTLPIELSFKYFLSTFKTAEWREYANKIEKIYVCWGLLGFSAISRVSPRQLEDPGSNPDPKHFSRLLVIAYSTFHIIFLIHHNYGNQKGRNDNLKLVGCGHHKTFFCIMELLLK